MEFENFIEHTLHIDGSQSSTDFLASFSDALERWATRLLGNSCIQSKCITLFKTFPKGEYLL